MRRRGRPRARPDHHGRRHRHDGRGHGRPDRCLSAVPSRDQRADRAADGAPRRRLRVLRRLQQRARQRPDYRQVGPAGGGRAVDHRLARAQAAAYSRGRPRAARVPVHRAAGDRRAVARGRRGAHPARLLRAMRAAGRPVRAHADRPAPQQAVAPLRGPDRLGRARRCLARAVLALRGLPEQLPGTAGGPGVRRVPPASPPGCARRAGRRRNWPAPAVAHRAEPDQAPALPRLQPGPVELRLPAGVAAAPAGARADLPLSTDL